MRAYALFDSELRRSRRYPRREFRAFFLAATAYIEASKAETLIHRDIAATISGLRLHLELERKRVPSEVLFDADRLDTMLFAGYDPYFEGDEPPDPDDLEPDDDLT